MQPVHERGEESPPTVLVYAPRQAAPLCHGLAALGLRVRHLHEQQQLCDQLAPRTAWRPDAVIADADADDAVDVCHLVRLALRPTVPVLLMTTGALPELLTAALPLMLAGVSLHSWPLGPTALAHLIRGCTAAAHADSRWQHASRAD